ncbi:hypothetical protein EON64_09240 [archaeon]|nr:MAG: hypothetical protein EON64_09240 [archaeon]
MTPTSSCCNATSSRTADSGARRVLQGQPKNHLVRTIDLTAACWSPRIANTPIVLGQVQSIGDVANLGCNDGGFYEKTPSPRSACTAP